MAPPPTSRSSGPQRQHQPRQASQRGKKEPAGGRRRRIVRARRPPQSIDNSNGETPTSNSDVAMNQSGAEATRVENYEEAVATAAAVVRANKNAEGDRMLRATHNNNSWTNAGLPAERPAAARAAAVGRETGVAEGIKLYVGNLDYATDEPRLREVFGAFGSVTDVFLPMERGTSRRRGFGFVTLAPRGAAEDAVSKMDRSQLDGRTIRVNESKPRGEADMRIRDENLVWNPLMDDQSIEDSEIDEKLRQELGVVVAAQRQARQRVGLPLLSHPKTAAIIIDEDDDDESSRGSDSSDLSMPELEDIIPNSNQFNVLSDDRSGISSSSSAFSGEESVSDVDSICSSEVLRLFGDDSSSGSEDSDSEVSLPKAERKLLLAMRRAKMAITTNDEESEDGNDDDNAAKCAICFLKHDQSNKWRRLLTLPCCGLEGKEKTSSTRFCAACILKMATTRSSDPSISNEYPSFAEERYETPVEQFYSNDCQTETKRFIECPRCRDLLAVNIERPKNYDSDDESCDCSDCRPNGNDWTDPKTAKSISVRTPSFKERCRYAGKKVGVARMLWRASFLHHGFMPRAALCTRISDENEVRRLVSWGIISKKSDDLFMMDKGNQKELIKLLDIQNIHVTEDYGEGDMLMLEILAGMGSAILASLTKWRIDHAWRMVNRLALLALFFKGYLPSFPLSFSQEWVVTALNVFAITMVIQFICVAIVYAGALFGVGLAVCYVLRRSTSPFSLMASTIALASFFAYRGAATFVYNSNYISWVGMVTPKSVIFVKKFIWG